MRHAVPTRASHAFSLPVTSNTTRRRGLRSGEHEQLALATAQETRETMSERGRSRVIQQEDVVAVDDHVVGLCNDRWVPHGASGVEIEGRKVDWALNGAILHVSLAELTARVWALIRDGTDFLAKADEDDFLAIHVHDGWAPLAQTAQLRDAFGVISGQGLPRTDAGS
jgi:hypothetical protein